MTTNDIFSSCQVVVLEPQNGYNNRTKDAIVSRHGRLKLRFCDGITEQGVAQKPVINGGT